MPKFDAKEFIERLDSGAFDLRLTEEIQKLTHDQVLEVCRLLAQRERERGI